MKKTLLFFMRPEGQKGALLINSILEDKFFDNCTILIYTGSSDKSRRIIATDRVKYINDINDESFDILISAGWPQIISSEIISKSRIASINCHGSFLPDYKGASAYRHMWANCEKEGGASIHFLTAKVDEGNLIAQCKFTIGMLDFPQEILNKVNYYSTLILKESLVKITSGYEGYPQSGGRYFYNNLSKKRMITHKVLNICFSLLSMPIFYTPHKIIKPKE